MGRNATIRIKNNTGYSLMYHSENVIHGKFQEGKRPPDEIKPGETGSFDVGNKTGALIGPKGSVKYKTVIKHKHLQVELFLVFFWNHPFSRATSVYTVSSEAPGFVNYSLDPAIPDGHDQKVTLTVEFKNLANVYDIKNWMRYIDDDQLLSQLTIPGTHDSGALKGGDAYECQTLGIADQLDRGIRFLDIRCKLSDDRLQIYHGDHYMGMSFQQVMNDCLAFLDTHTDECIIMSVKNEGDIPIANPFATEIEDLKARWYLNTDIPKLHEARGKIVLLRRFASDSRMGIPALPWEDNGSFLTDNDRIYVQDHYKVYDTKESITGKWEQIQATLTDAQNPESSLMFINFSSGAEGITPKMLATGDAIISDLDGMNDRLYNYVTNIEHARLGIIVMDFPEFPDELFIPYIISTNKFSR